MLHGSVERKNLMEKTSNKLVDLSIAFAVEILNLVKYLKRTERNDHLQSKEALYFAWWKNEISKVKFLQFAVAPFAGEHIQCAENYGYCLIYDFHSPCLCGSWVVFDDDEPDENNIYCKINDFDKYCHFHSSCAGDGIEKNKSSDLNETCNTHDVCDIYRIGNECSIVSIYPQYHLRP